MVTPPIDLQVLLNPPHVSVPALGRFDPAVDEVFDPVDLVAGQRRVVRKVETQAFGADPALVGTS